MMTRKHFEMIAAIIKDCHDEPTWRVAHRVADALAESNPRFDRARFLEACGVNFDVACPALRAWGLDRA